MMSVVVVVKERHGHGHRDVCLRHATQASALALFAPHYLLSFIEQAHSSKTMTRWFRPKLPITIREKFRQKIAAAVHMTTSRR